MKITNTEIFRKIPGPRRRIRLGGLEGWFQRGRVDPSEGIPETDSIYKPFRLGVGGCPVLLKLLDAGNDLVGYLARDTRDPDLRG